MKFFVSWDSTIKHSALLRGLIKEPTCPLCDEQVDLGGQVVPGGVMQVGETPVVMTTVGVLLPHTCHTHQTLEVSHLTVYGLLQQVHGEEQSVLEGRPL